jgi:diketogulonate reductase-like aldo/keto reductase
MRKSISRRAAIQLMGLSGVSMLHDPLSSLPPFEQAMLTRTIPSTGEKLPVVGLGTWRQFDVPDGEKQPLREVLKRMNARGGKVIDSSPMYGRSEEVIGDVSNDVNLAEKYFYATKVWTRGRQDGIDQMNHSMRKMRRTKMDLMQIHNLVDWQTHLATLRKWKEEGKIRYIGITHYTDSSHNELEKILAGEKLDFVQFNYSIAGRHAENRLLHAARERGTAVIINQPFDSGSLFDVVRGKTLPPWAADYGIKNWAQYFLKYIISNPAVTCAIPGTSDPVHVVENMDAAVGPLPDDKARKRMVEYFEGKYSE